MMARFKWYLDPLYYPSTKKIIRVGPPLAKLSGSVHVFIDVVGVFCFVSLNTYTFSFKKRKTFVPKINKDHGTLLHKYL